MSYKYMDINNVADWSCIRCDKPLDRIGSHCAACMVELQEEIDHLEAEREKHTAQTWEFLNSEFQKIFRK